MNERIVGALTSVADTDGVPRRYPAGTLLFAEGDRGTDVLLIRSGSVRIVAGDDEEIDEIGRGAILGEFAAIDGFPRSATALAVTDVDAVAIDAVAALRALAATPDIDLDALRSAVNASRRRTERRAIDAGGLPVASLAAFLARRVDNDPGTVISVEPGLLAAALGVSLELTARALDHLHHAGLVSLERGVVVVHDPAALRQIANLPAG